MFQVGYMQFNPVFGQIKSNLNQVVNALKNVRADVIVLPELAFTGYYFKNRAELNRLAENPENSATIDSLQNLCRDRNFHLITGFAEKAADKIFNSALLIYPDKTIRTYRKLHLFNTEKDCFDPGDTPLEVYSVNGIKIGMMICFDWVFPEVARILTLQGADLLCHPANLVLTHCQQAMLTRSLENAVFTVTANRFGLEKRPHGELTFTGQSQITAPKGRLLHRAPAATTQAHFETIDISDAQNKKITAQNHLLGDRRPEFYTPLL